MSEAKRYTLRLTRCVDEEAIATSTVLGTEAYASAQLSALWNSHGQAVLQSDRYMATMTDDETGHVLMTVGGPDDEDED